MPMASGLLSQEPLLVFSALISASCTVAVLTLINVFFFFFILAGIGRECALYLASRGVSSTPPNFGSSIRSNSRFLLFVVVLVARRAEQLKLVEDAIKLRYPAVSTRVVSADLSTADVRR